MKGEVTLMYELNLLLPDISSKKYAVDEKFTVLKGYLTELNETLSIALSSLDCENLSPSLSQKLEGAAKKESLYKAAQKNDITAKKLKKEISERFETLKSDIISTADEIEREYTSAIEKSEKRIEQSVSQNYTLKSDFGEYKDSAQSLILQNASSIKANAESIESVETELESYKLENKAEIGVLSDAIISQVSNVYAKKSEVDELNETVSSKITQTASDIKESFSSEVSRLSSDISSVGGSVSTFISSVDAYIRRGELSDGVFGIEIGRSDSLIKARFTNDRLTFFQGDCEVAYISGSNLYITRAQVLDCLEIGNESDGFFAFDVTNNGLEVRWSYGD